MFRSCWVMLFALLLSACGGGGGGSGGGNLQVDFSYTSGEINQFDQVSLSPQLMGMDGNSTSCSVSSGSLPQGLSLDGSCNIVGAATQTGTYNATINLTTPNYSGSLSAPITLQVSPTQLIAMPAMPIVQAWQPAPATPIVELNESGDQLVGDNRVIAGTVAFTLARGSATLPDGLGLDPNTGAVDGMAEYGGVFNLQITATITNNSGVFTIGPTPVSLTVASGPPLFNYGNNFVTVNANNPVSLAPMQSVTPSGAKTVTYSTTTSQLPPGVTLNPTTGIISGTPVVAGNYSFTVTETIERSDGTSIQTGIVVGIQVDGFLLVYPNQPYPFTPSAAGAFVNPTTREVVTSAVPVIEPCNGCSYSMILAPGSTATSSPTSWSSWIMVDPVSSAIYITTPPTGTPAGQYNFYVVITGNLNGTQVVSMSPFNVNLTY